jgi:pimeloyl-ACP methyl ester carboxylesterase
MPILTTDDGVKLHYEECGSGTPIVFVHEFAGDCRTWEPQQRHFSRRYRCIAYNARGYPPSDVPVDVERYSQQRARDDILAVLDALGIERAHVVGNSMGGFATLHFGMAYSPRALSLVVAGCGYGAHPSQYAQFQAQSRELAKSMLDKGMAHVAATYGHGPSRLQLKEKDPRGFAEFVRQFSEHSAQGSANTMLGYQARRPSLYDLTADMARITAPTLIVAGDEDDAVLEPSLLMKRTIPAAGLVVLPKSGHMTNLEDPALFNRLLEDFFHQVEAGRWPQKAVNGEQ